MAWPDTASPYERRSIITGMRVRGEDGTFLGYVAVIGRDHLYMRRWPFSRHWAVVPLSRVHHVTRGAVVLEGREAGERTRAWRDLHGEVPTQTWPLAEVEAK